MSFDETQLPLRIGFGARGGPSFATEIVAIDGGYERRNQNWSQARRRYDARTGLRSADDAAALLAFFHARAGRARGFRLKDWADFTSAANGVGAPLWSNQAVAVGDGVATQFQLVKIYTSGGVTHRRLIRKPVAGSVTIGVNGAQVVSGWSVDVTTGIVSFAVAPANAATITAGYVFDVPVRFDTDALSLAAEDFTSFRTDIPIIEIRV
ncbi:MAG: DUF2460 domain-containing protein [Alphaproteobacteria bacterium]